jgi:hypothetical protein
MKPGDLVQGTTAWGTLPFPNIGLLLKESPRTNVWGDEVYVWWYILTEEGIVVEDVGYALKLVQSSSLP